jgi:hypothetical protein
MEDFRGAKIALWYRNKFRKLAREKYISNGKDECKRHYAIEAGKKIRKQYLSRISLDLCINNYVKNIHEIPIIRITNNLTKRIYKKLREANASRLFKYNNLLGCSLSEFKSYIESKFTKGMSFDNYGSWEIDHIIPVSKFDFSNIEQIRQCCHHTNLQPLWKHDNRVKYNK